MLLVTKSYVELLNTVNDQLDGRNQLCYGEHRAVYLLEEATTATNVYNNTYGVEGCM